MFTIVDLLIVLIMVAISLFLTSKIYHIDRELKMMMYVFSFVPIFNGFIILISLITLGHKYYLKLKKEKKELEILNVFKTCASCEINVRTGYIRDNVCPICKEHTVFYIVKEDYKPSDKIDEQREIKNLKRFKNSILNEKTEEQELKHLKVLEKRLKNKSL